LGPKKKKGAKLRGLPYQGKRAKRGTNGKKTQLKKKIGQMFRMGKPPSHSGSTKTYRSTIIRIGIESGHRERQKEFLLFWPVGNLLFRATSGPVYQLARRKKGKFPGRPRTDLHEKANVAEGEKENGGPGRVFPGNWQFRRKKGHKLAGKKNGASGGTGPIKIVTKPDVGLVGKKLGKGTNLDRTKTGKTTA